MQLTLQIIDGPNAGKRIWIRQGQRIEVGRSELNDLAIPTDPQISSRHFTIELGDKVCKVRDQNSTNGTFVNEQRVAEADLHDGDKIVAGQCTFSVHIERTKKSAKVQPPSSATATQFDSADSATPQQTKTSGGKLVQSEAAQAAPLRRPEVSATRPVTESQAKKSVQNGISLEEPKSSMEDADKEDLEPVDSPVGLLEIVNETDFPVATILWENARGEGRLTVIIKATFTIVPGGAAGIAAEQLPVFTADEPYDDDDPNSPLRFETDMVPFKPKTDVVLVGRARAPQKRPVNQLDVRLHVGTLQKIIRVFGDRRWVWPTRLAVVPRISSPEPFVEMELNYQRAFGGIDQAAALYCQENLSGVGFIGKLSPKSIHDKPLPNLEDPRDLIHSWESHPKPVGLGFYGRGWMPRLRYAGTYDERYRRERAPLPPEDFSYEFYNGAHPDLQVEGFLRGGEDVQLQNLTPAGDVQFQLPRTCPLVTITRIASSSTASADAGGEDPDAAHTQAVREEKPVPAVLDTLVFVPDEAIFYEVFRVVFSLPDLESPDVAQIKISTRGT